MRPIAYFAGWKLSLKVKTGSAPVKSIKRIEAQTAGRRIVKL